MALTVNSYFADQVKSIALQTAQGPCTAGVMDIGEYTFGTSQDELMQVVVGELTVLLPGASEWQRFTAGTEFSVPANSEFQVKVATQTVYLCYYS